MHNSKKLYLSLRNRFVTRFPAIRFLKRWLQWRVIQTVRRIVIRFKSSSIGLQSDPFKIYWIDPKTLYQGIYKQIEGVPDTAVASGVIMGGDWDLAAQPVEELEIIRSARARFTHGKKWQDTDHYKSLKDSINAGKPRKGCINEADIQNYFNYFDSLYNNIKKEGYKLQRDINDPKFAGTPTVENEIAVHINRHGQFLFCNGAHRLAITLILGIDKIPVKVCIRHAKWVDFYNKIMMYARKNKGQIYQPLTHPDLQWVPTAHKDKRIPIIQSHLPSTRGALLDIGCNWGYFCHCFEQIGFDCHAVESDPENIYFLKKLKTAQNRRFEIITQSILTYQTQIEFDVILALNIFHHFLKNVEYYNAFIAFLERTSMKTLFFEAHHTSEPQMQNAYHNFPPEEFVQFILQHSCLTKSELIGKAEDGRPLYKLWK